MPVGVPMLLGLAVLIMLAAVAFAGYETWTLLKRAPANDRDAAPLPARYVFRMRTAAALLAVALVLVLAGVLIG